MTDAVFLVRVVLDGDDDTGLAATNVYIRLREQLIVWDWADEEPSATQPHPPQAGIPGRFFRR